MSFDHLDNIQGLTKNKRTHKLSFFSLKAVTFYLRHREEKEKERIEERLQKREDLLKERQERREDLEKERLAEEKEREKAREHELNMRRLDIKYEGNKQVNFQENIFGSSPSSILSSF